MAIGVLHVELHILAAQSLKDKRSAIKSLKDQLRAHFNVSVAELEADEKWQRASLGVAAVGEDRWYVEGCLRQVVEWIERNRFVNVIRVEQEYW